MRLAKNFDASCQKKNKNDASCQSAIQQRRALHNAWEQRNILAQDVSTQWHAA